MGVRRWQTKGASAPPQKNPLTAAPARQMPSAYAEAGTFEGPTGGISLPSSSLGSSHSGTVSVPQNMRFVAPHHLSEQEVMRRSAEVNSDMERTQQRRLQEMMQQIQGNDAYQPNRQDSEAMRLYQQAKLELSRQGH